MSTSPVAVAFAKLIAPRLATELEERRDAIVKNAGSWMKQRAADMAFPVALRNVETLTEAGCDSLLDLFGGMTLSQVAEKLYAHQLAKGAPIHESIQYRVAYIRPEDPIWDGTSTDWDGGK